MHAYTRYVLIIYIQSIFVSKLHYCQKTLLKKCLKNIVIFKIIPTDVVYYMK